MLTSSEPGDANRSLARPEVAEQEGDERALAGPVRSREPEHLAGAQLDREIVKGANLATEEAAVPLPDMVERDHDVCAHAGV
jgi:hypothetical protein